MRQLTFVVVVAMPEEWTAFTEILTRGRSVDDQGGYLETSLQFGDVDVTIIATMCTDQGNWASFDAVSIVLGLNRVVDHWFLVGVGGGLRSELSICDVVVSSGVYYYPHRASIKDVPAARRNGVAAPSCHEHCATPQMEFTTQVINGEIPEAINHLEASQRRVPHPRDLGWPVTRAALDRKFPGLAGRKEVGRLQLRRGTIASGEFVCESAWMREQLHNGDRKAMVVEMEGYGFARRLNASQIRSFSIVRGISDAAGGDKAVLDDLRMDDGGKLTQRASAWMASRACLHLMALLAADKGAEPPAAESASQVEAATAKKLVTESAVNAGLLRPGAVDEVEQARRGYLLTRDTVVFLDPQLRVSRGELEAVARNGLTPGNVLEFIRGQGARFDADTERRFTPVVYRAARAAAAGGEGG